MKANITDQVVLRAIDPSEVSAYLLSKGWIVSAKIGDKGIVLVHSGGNEKYEILLPIKKQLGDFVPRMAELLQTIEDFEERSQLVILKDITSVNFDIVRIRLIGSFFEDGSMPLDKSGQTFTAAKELMLAAACSAIQPRILYTSKRPNQVLEYLGGVRLGQSEQGSYVLTIRSQLDAIIADQGILFGKNSFR